MRELGKQFALRGNITNFVEAVEVINWQLNKFLCNESSRWDMWGVGGVGGGRGVRGVRGKGSYFRRECGKVTIPSVGLRSSVIVNWLEDN